jgi:hypothetical protein
MLKLVSGTGFIALDLLVVCIRMGIHIESHLQQVSQTIGKAVDSYPHHSQMVGRRHNQPVLR